MPWGAVGFFGKLPARGDFVRRGLAQDFVDAWDAWLAAGIAESRAQLGAEWLPAFLEAPIWNFALAPGLAGQAGMAGIVLPSVDRAGRYFPLTVAAACTRAPLLIARPDWFAALAAAGVSALAEEAGLEAFEARIAALEPAPEPAAPSPFAGGIGAREPLALLAAKGPSALFWTAGGARVAPRTAILPALPPAGLFADLLRDPPHGADPPVREEAADSFEMPRFNAELFGDAP